MLINTLFSTNTPEPDTIWRVLYVSRKLNTLVYIDIFEKKAWPISANLVEMETGFTQLTYLRVEHDPMTAFQREEAAYSPVQRERRDQAWQAIEPIINSGMKQFQRHERGQMIARQKEITGRSEKTLYRDLRRYWQRGLVKNALIPGFDNCGGKGKDRTYQQKAGRPSRIEILDNCSNGKVLTDEDKEQILAGIKKHYLNRKRRSLRQAYQRTLEDSFVTGMEWVDGRLVKVLKPANERPTFHQFRYLFETHFRKRDVATRRHGINEFNLKHRRILSDSTVSTIGPGSQYQIDATIGDIYLRSSSDPTKIVGRATVYFVFDVFSRMITGYYAGFRHPGWQAGALALANALSDKVAHCAKYGVSITVDQWPAAYKPIMLLADNAEFATFISDIIINTFGIELPNTPPYRGDYKAIAERGFRTLGTELLQEFPGYVCEKKRGDPDYRPEAQLNIEQLNRAIIEFILFYNNQRPLQSYPFSQDMLKDQVRPYPVDIWRWGVQNLGGLLRESPSPQVLKRLLLPQAKASITERGVYFRGLTYASQYASTHSLYEKVRIEGKRIGVKVRYNPDDSNELYMHINNEADWERCTLIENTANRAFRNLNWQEVEMYKDTRNVSLAREESSEIDSRVHYNAKIDAIKAEARAAVEQAGVDKLSKRSQLINIRQNRAEELLIEKGTPLQSSSIPVQGEHGLDAELQDEELYLPEPSYLTQLRRSE